ncbi:MAG: hypothetical protein GF317_01515 [Candidatus Lokiarchaeota archaeon]|nr:hypothetical protein [Candidatus Lokiarchaeota archaeon]MBD3198622.1 hypothetical protein [Candidatus Lokiarchaeota archaeon]
MFQIDLALDLARFILVYVVYGIYAFSYIFLAYKILKRNFSRLNFLLAGFYISGALGVIINFIYVFIYHQLIVIILYSLTFYFLCLSLFFLLMFIIVLKKSEKFISKGIQIIMFILFSIGVMSLFFLTEGVVINESTGWKPVWSLSFTIGSLILCNITAIIPTIYYSLKIYRQFSDPNLKRKWKYFLIGLLGYLFLYYGNTINLYLAVPMIRNIWGYLSMLSLPFLLSIYYGVGRSF